MPFPGLVVVTRAIRVEGTSYHYLPPAETVDAEPNLAKLLESELKNLSLPVLTGLTWTTDAPYRRTERQLSEHAKAGVLAVEMQAASLLAFAEAYQFPVGIVAYMTNGVGQTGELLTKERKCMNLKFLSMFAELASVLFRYRAMSLDTF